MKTTIDFNERKEAYMSKEITFLWNDEEYKIPTDVSSLLPVVQNMQSRINSGEAITDIMKDVFAAAFGSLKTETLMQTMNMKGLNEIFYLIASTVSGKEYHLGDAEKKAEEDEKGMVKEQNTP